MPFERPSINTIKDRIEKGIESRLFGKVALLRNAILRVLARVFAGTIHGNYGYLAWIAQQIFVTKAEGVNLDNPHGLMWNVLRRPGSFASGTVQFTGNNGTVIPVDTRVQNEDGVEYGTTAIVTITGGVASTTVQAVESGTAGSYIRPNPPDPIYLQMVSPISGVDGKILVSGDITGGEDIEDDEAYRARILQRIQTIPTGGSAADYVRWATEFPGVARAWCYPLNDGPGTVVTAITTSGTDPVPSSQLLSDVEAYIGDRKPVTATHRVASIEDSSHNPGKTILAMGLRITPISMDLQAVIQENIATLFLPHRPGSTIPISQIRGAIASSGVVDYVIDWFTLDGSWYVVGDIALTGFQYPWLGTIAFSELV